jgi:hypothetical protein
MFSSARGGNDDGNDHGEAGNDRGDGNDHGEAPALSGVRRPSCLAKIAASDDAITPPASERGADGRCVKGRSAPDDALNRAVAKFAALAPGVLDAS